jgi:hypothetical protein
LWEDDGKPDPRAVKVAESNRGIQSRNPVAGLVEVAESVEDGGEL